MDTPTPSLRNFSAAAAASATPPIVVSAMTHSTFEPSGYRRDFEISLATDCACRMVWSSSDSRTPPRRPSIVGRIPTRGNPPGHLGVRSVLPAIFRPPRESNRKSRSRCEVSHCGLQSATTDRRRGPSTNRRPCPRSFGVNQQRATRASGEPAPESRQRRSP